MTKLKRIRVEGFKSIKKMDLELGNINVIIGANGSGKSNFLSIFRLFNFLTDSELQNYIGIEGGANSLLHYGAQVNSKMRIETKFEVENGSLNYCLTLSHAAPDTLIFTEEQIEFIKSINRLRKPKVISLGIGHKETQIVEKNSKIDYYPRVLLDLLKGCHIFNFHNTSQYAQIRQLCNINDNKQLKINGGNLAAFLYWIKETQREYYNRILSTIRLVAPHFKEFELLPYKLDPNKILLEWHETGSDYQFGPHQLPDGLLRFIALTTLLLQPNDSSPNVIVIDEPELGLHPYAINILGSLIHQASFTRQIIIATQSINLLEQFEPEDVIVVNRIKGASEFSRLNTEELKEWIKEYTLGELWEKNVLGGRP